MLGRRRIFPIITLLALPALAALAIGAEAAPSAGDRSPNYYSLTSDVTELQCNGDSATLTLRVSSGKNRIADHPVKISFFDGDGTITDPATGATGVDALTGITDEDGEWRITAAPTTGSMN